MKRSDISVLCDFGDNNANSSMFRLQSLYYVSHRCSPYETPRSSTTTNVFSFLPPISTSVVEPESILELLPSSFPLEVNKSSGKGKRVDRFGGGFSEAEFQMLCVTLFPSASTTGVMMGRDMNMKPKLPMAVTSMFNQ